MGGPSGFRPGHCRDPKGRRNAVAAREVTRHASPRRYDSGTGHKPGRRGPAGPISAPSERAHHDHLQRRRGRTHRPARAAPGGRPFPQPRAPQPGGADALCHGRDQGHRIFDRVEAEQTFLSIFEGTVVAENPARQPGAHQWAIGRGRSGPSAGAADRGASPGCGPVGLVLSACRLFSPR